MEKTLELNWFSVEKNIVERTILRIRKNNNRADLDSGIYKEIKKYLDFEDVTKEFLDDRIHMLINDGKILNKLNGNADSYYVNKTPQLQGVTLTPTISI